MKTIRKIDPMSTAKLAGLAGFCWGLAIAILVLIGIGMTQYMGRLFMGYSMLMPMVGPSVVIALPIAYGVTLFISGYIGAIFYNFVAKRIGGIKIDMR